MRKKAFILAGLFLLTIVLSSDVSAQCVMCKMNAENAAENGGADVAEGFNSGIVYLMGIPYSLLMIGALVFFRGKIFSFIKR